MKKFLITIVLSLSLVAKSIADEGMWLPLLLGQQVYNEKKKIEESEPLSPSQFLMTGSTLKKRYYIFHNMMNC